MTGSMKLKPNDWALIIGLLGIIALMMCSSCSKDFYCSRCPIKDSVYTSIHDTTIIRDTIVKIEERILTLHDTVPCADFELNRDSGGVKIQIKVVNHYLTASASCAALEIRLRMYDKIRTIYHSRELARFVSQKTRPSWWSYLETWITLILIAGVVTLKVLKIYYKIPIPFL